jgi:hypothetical protein
VREQARGKADGELLLAAAQAKAKALEAQGQALRSNTSLVQLEVAKRWSGNLPLNMWQRAVTTPEPARRNTAARRPLRAPPIQSRGGLA